jgi:hypothetical protein
MLKSSTAPAAAAAILARMGAVPSGGVDSLDSPDSTAPNAAAAAIQAPMGAVSEAVRKEGSVLVQRCTLQLHRPVDSLDRRDSTAS